MIELSNKIYGILDDCLDINCNVCPKLFSEWKWETQEEAINFIKYNRKIFEKYNNLYLIEMHRYIPVKEIIKKPPVEVLGE
ncbi:MAG: hypothetical protein ACRDE5_03620 [Ginsengibacter sp.]